MLRKDRPTDTAFAQAAKLRGILESVVPAIITIDNQGSIESINPSTERLFGYDAAELLVKAPDAGACRITGVSEAINAPTRSAAESQ
jgi:PAS domain-containing protein